MKTIEELSPREILSLAIVVEETNAKQYADWADRFRPYDHAITVLLDDLTSEEEAHRDQLTDLYLSCFGDHVLSMDPAAFNMTFESVSLPDDHFFIVDGKAARTILESALQAEERMQHFYQGVLDQTPDILLRVVYEGLIHYEDTHIEKIKMRLQACQA